MQVIYLISVVALFVLAMFVKKTQEKQDFLKELCIKLILFLCYQTFICLVFSLVHIPINLISLIIINVLITILQVLIIRKKGKQEYYFNKKDLGFIVILAMIVGTIVYVNCGTSLNIKYVMTDAAVHYVSDREFYENDSLLLFEDDVKSSGAMMPGAYSNIGILFKVFASWIGEVNLYKIYILFDIFMLYLAGLTFFVTIKKYTKNTLTYILACIVSVIYMLGYPLNSMLYGYSYLGIGVLIINAIIAIMQEIKIEENISKPRFLVEMFMLAFGLFFSYYLFVPPIYCAIFIYYLIYFHKKRQKWLNKELFLYTGITLIIPCILGFCYHVLPGMLSTNELQVGVLVQTEGYIYRNLFSNILPFVPFVIYYFVKDKSKDFSFITCAIWILYMLILFASIYLLNVSTYYFFKTYFVLWQIVIYIFFRGICYMRRKR